MNHFKLESATVTNAATLVAFSVDSQREAKGALLVDKVFFAELKRQFKRKQNFL